MGHHGTELIANFATLLARPSCIDMEGLQMLQNEFIGDILRHRGASRRFRSRIGRKGKTVNAVFFGVGG
ncbi:hypothetical protein TM49_20435 [Martelella endophytica]|uniref:Uncharacterized protein n=1 Tax=Martelella endophytica TaxID=1486262 RepID=A0A0D5LUS6_MAREN|nr:hypothetical protein TM49_20435 [Martelella endophytica]